MNVLRIVFMGTPEFAVMSLMKLHISKHEVVGVITAPDRPAGRGKKLRQSAVKQYAMTEAIPVLQPTNLKDDDFVIQLEALKADLFVVVAFRMLPERVWQMPPMGTFNLHASLLPQYRGAAPINWALINGETTTGVTTFFIDEKIDTGAIISQKTVDITPDENAGSLHDKLLTVGADLVLSTTNAIATGTVKTQIQSVQGQMRSAKKLHAENTKIDWDAPSATIVNLIRGLSPYPGAWCNLVQEKDEQRVKIYKATTHYDTHKDTIGQLSIQKTEIRVATKDGYVIIKEIQLPGKRNMEIKALLNGYTFAENAKLR